MVWLSLIMTIIELLMKVPAIIDTIKKIWAIIQDLKGAEQRQQAKAFRDAMRAQLQHVEKGFTFAAAEDQPVVAFYNELVKKYAPKVA